MIIGLVRHYKVAYKPEYEWMTSKEFNQWVKNYDLSEIHIPNQSITNHVQWDVCISSNLSRATKTSEIIFKGPIIKTDQLREIGMRSVIQTSIKLHYYVWQMIARLAWFFSHKSQEESRRQTRLRARNIVNEMIENHHESNVLVVSHGAFMKYLITELSRRGYTGKRSFTPRNGEIYTFVKME